MSAFSAFLTIRRTVHGWFGLTYASYLVWPRSLMQDMPEDWQHRFVKLAEELEEAYPGADSTYAVVVREGDGRFARDLLSEYRRPDPIALEQARQYPIN